MFNNIKEKSMNSKTFGKTIELFFVNGTSDGVVTAELRNWSGKAIKIPRIEVSKYNNEELSCVGIYLLYCTDEIGNEKIYVGESEDVYKRLTRHISEYSKGNETYYWSYAVAFVDNRLDKAEIRYIEDRLVNEIYDADPSRLLTKNSYSNTNLKASQIAVAEEFINNIKTLLDALGIKLVTIAPQAESDTQYMFCNGKASKAKGFISNNGFTVLKDSTINPILAPSFEGMPYCKLRTKLMEEGVIIDYKFTKDYEFNAPSAASSVVLGRVANGQLKWKTQSGKMLKDL